MKKQKKDFSPDDLRKVVELMDQLTVDGGRCSISALSRKAGISRYKAGRLLEALEKTGAQPQIPEQDEELYGNIVKGARPVLESLANQHKEAVYMAILRGDEVLLLDMVDPLPQERKESFLGKRFPFFTNAAGKVMRAIDSWDLLERMSKRWRGRRARFPDLAALGAELEQIRQKGVAIECSGMGDGVITVAVAVRDYAGKVVGAIMMLGPSIRMLGERLESEIIPSLQVGAEALSCKFGYAKP
jgi:IclR family transcriptional regulator, KDG regulon repressor